MKRLFFAMFIFTSSCQLHAQEREVKQTNWLISAGMNAGISGQEGQFFVNELDKPTSATGDFKSFEGSVKYRVAPNSIFYVGLNYNYAVSKVSEEIWHSYDVRFQSESRISSIGPSFTLLKRVGNTFAFNMALTPSYNVVNYDYHVEGRLTEQARSTGLGIKFEFAPTFFLSNEVSLGPKIGFHRIMFGSFDETLISANEYNYDFERYDHLMLTLGISLNLHF